MSKGFDTVSIIGLGYIGLPTAAVFAARKVNVIGVDVNANAVATINRGDIHIVEPELDIVVRAVVSEGYLRATIHAEPADAFLITVPTPFKGDHEPDLSFVKAACDGIAPVLKKGDLVILESTSPVGATEKVAEWLAEKCPDLSFPQNVGESADINVAHCPERVLPGHVMHELIENDRIIGGMTTRCAARAVELYKIFVKGDCIVTNTRTAELCKLTENSYRDVNIAFANELSLVCDDLGVDVWELIQLANRHPRVSILQPGPGVGGHCIAVDPWFIVSSAPGAARLIRTAREVNDEKPVYIYQQILKCVSGIDSPSIACLGLAFKADIDDLRESPAVHITKMLAGIDGSTILAVEPNISKLPTSLLKYENIELMSCEDATKSADVVVLLVDHREFRSLDRSKLDSSKTIIDTRGILK